MAYARHILTIYPPMTNDSMTNDPMTKTTLLHLTVLLHYTPIRKLLLVTFVKNY
jgi:hypothetical protein